jgi:DNA-binding NarL/FixJ family response regulator
VALRGAVIAKKPRSTPMSSPKLPSAKGDRSVSFVRVLVVDDYEPFRQFVCSTLEQRPDLQVISEASDGLEAVQKAEELQPHLIVLDIGLPRLNGIEAARRIRKLSPESKILFLTEESSADVVQEVLSLGALGYVVKAHAGSELLAAVEAVCQDRQFVSKGLSGHEGTSATDARVPGHLSRKEALPSLALGKEEINRSHAVQFYSDVASFIVGFTSFIETALNAGDTVIVVVTESHRNSLFQRLQAQGFKIGAAIEHGSLIPLDVTETLSTFMVNDLPDPVRFLKVAGDLVAAAAKGAKGERPRVAACGECAPTLLAQGRADAAIQLEHLWDEIAKTRNVDILCGYVLKSSQREQESHTYERICAEHSAVLTQ